MVGGRSPASEPQMTKHKSPHELEAQTPPAAYMPMPSSEKTG